MLTLNIFPKLLQSFIQSSRSYCANTVCSLFALFLTYIISPLPTTTSPRLLSLLLNSLLSPLHLPVAFKHTMRLIAFTRVQWLQLATLKLNVCVCLCLCVLSNIPVPLLPACGSEGSCVARHYLVW